VSPEFRGDFWHWPTDNFPTVWNAIYGAGYDYENSGGRYNYLFLKSDETAIANRTQPLLGHGGMVDGAILNHRYQATLNGQPIEDLLTNIYRGFGASNDTGN